MRAEAHSHRQMRSFTRSLTGVLAGKASMQATTAKAPIASDNQLAATVGFEVAADESMPWAMSSI